MVNQRLKVQATAEDLIMHSYHPSTQSEATFALTNQDALRWLRFGWMNLLIGICFGFGISTQAFAIQGTTKAETKSETPHPLSVPPLEEEMRKYPENRPEWIGQAPDLEGLVHRWPICSIPSLNDTNADQDLLEQARAAVRAYIRDQVPDCRPLVMDTFSMNDNRIRALMDPGNTYRGKVTIDDQEWYEVATQLVFNPEFRDEVKRLNQQAFVGDRMRGLIALVGFAAISLASLSTVLRMMGGRRTTTT